MLQKRDVLHQYFCLVFQRKDRKILKYKLGLCDMDPKKISIFFFFITILTQTGMLYSYKCILCEFETLFPKETN